LHDYSLQNRAPGTKAKEQVCIAAFPLAIVSKSDIIAMRNKHRKTLARIFEAPVRPDIPWADIESLFISLGAEISEGRGSRVRVHLNGVRAVFHRPHPEKETDRGAVRSVRRFLTEAGVQ
jgi:hypothetical protein